jgi:DNA-binding transcriptional ArsR family regulator
MSMTDFDSSARILKTLGHPLRLKIVAELIQHPSCVKEIWECLILPQAVVSQHLAILKNTGIIEGQRKGVEMHYVVVDSLTKLVVDSLSKI